MASYRTNGVPPKPESKRRRRNKRASYGAARPTIVADSWNKVQRSCAAPFYSDADWVRARLELFHLNALMTGRRQLTPSAWSAVQAGLNELLLSPVVKRRAGIELRCKGVDAGCWSRGGVFHISDINAKS